MRNNHGRKASHLNAKDLSERLLQVATLAGILLGLPVAITKGRPTSTVLLLAVALLCLTTLVLHLWRKHLPSGDRKHEGQRWFITGLASIAFLSLAVTIAVPASRSYFIYSLLGFHHRSPSLRADGLAAAEAAQYERVILPIYNPRSYDQEVKSITLDVEWRPIEACFEQPPSYFFQLEDKVFVSRKAGAAMAAVMLRSGAASGLRVTATGFWVYGQCDMASHLTLTFVTPGLLLLKSATTMIAIDIPKQIQAVFSKTHPMARVQHKTADIPDLSLPTGAFSDLAGYAVFGLTVRTTSGVILSACIPSGCRKILIQWLLQVNGSG